MNRYRFPQRPFSRSRVMPTLAAALAALFIGIPLSCVHAQGTNMTGATLTLSGWASIGGGSYNSVSGGSLVLGDGATADSYSMSLGMWNYVYDDSLAVGESNDVESISLAVGQNGTALNSSLAIGSFSQASDYSLATGESVIASDHSVATGVFTMATGTGAFSAGYSTTATGDSSISAGYRTTAQSYSSFVIGRYNKTNASYNPSSWVGTDPLLVVGNGTGTGTQANDAFVVYKNGNVKMSKAQGDISMGAFQ